MSDAYDWLALDDGEEILWEGGISPKSMLGVYLVGVPLILALGLGLLIVVPAHLRIRHTDYVITDRGVYKKTGILSRSVTEIEYDKVQNTSFSAGPLGRYLGFGTVGISTAGGSGVEMELRAVEDPTDVQRRLSRQAKRARGDGDDAAGDAKADVLDEVLAELRAIRRAVESSDRDAAPADARGDDGERP